MALFVQLSGEDSDTELPIEGAQTNYTLADAPRINVIKRVDIALRSSQLHDIFITRYPGIVDGAELAPIVNDIQTKNFFSEWFSNNNLSLILSTLLKLNPDKIAKILEEQTEEPEVNPQLRNLFEGRAVISNSVLTEVIKEVATALVNEWGLGYQDAYRICFTLVLVPSQRNRHFIHIPVIDEVNHIPMIDQVRNVLVARILERHEL